MMLATIQISVVNRHSGETVSQRTMDVTEVPIQIPISDTRIPGMQALDLQIQLIAVTTTPVVE